MVARPPRFHFIPTLGVAAAGNEARAVLSAGLGLPTLDEDDVHQAYGRGRLSIYVDTSGASSRLDGFTPMFGTDDLEAAIAHLHAHGCTSGPMPWALDAPGVLMQGPGGLRFCVVPLDDVLEQRAREFVDEVDEIEGSKGRVDDSGGLVDDAPDLASDPHRRPTLVGGATSPRPAPKASTEKEK